MRQLWADKYILDNKANGPNKWDNRWDDRILSGWENWWFNVWWDILRGQWENNDSRCVESERQLNEVGITIKWRVADCIVRVNGIEINESLRDSL